MKTRIVTRPAFRLIGCSTRATITSDDTDSNSPAHLTGLPPSVHALLSGLASGEPSGLLELSTDVDPDYAEGTDFTFMRGVAASALTAAPDGLQMLEIPAGTWLVIDEAPRHPLGAIPVQIAAVWLACNPWRLRPGPSIVATRDDSAGSTTRELWLPVEPTQEDAPDPGAATAG